MLYKLNQSLSIFFLSIEKPKPSPNYNKYCTSKRILILFKFKNYLLFNESRNAASPNSSAEMCTFSIKWLENLLQELLCFNNNHFQRIIIRDKIFSSFIESVHIKRFLYNILLISLHSYIIL